MEPDVREAPGVIVGHQVLGRFLRGVLRLTGARSATLFLPARPGAGPAFVLHEGDPPLIPELESQSSPELSVRRAGTGEAGTAGRLRVLESRDPDAVLIELPSLAKSSASRETAAFDAAAASPGRRLRDGVEPADAPPVGWLGLRLAPGDGAPVERLSVALPGAPVDSPSSQLWPWIVAIGGGLAEHSAETSALLSDSVTGLAGRSAFQTVLERQLSEAAKADHPVGLLFLNPDAFVLVNERFGRDAADEVVRELVARANGVLRATDVVARWGGVTFAVLLPGADGAGASAIGEKILAAVQGRRFVGGALHLALSVGAAAYEPGSGAAASAAELVRRADQALNAAKRAGGGRLVLWQEGSEAEKAGSFDRLSGIFTGRPSRDYRNMALLWDAVNIMARSSDAETLAAKVVEKIEGAFAPRRAALFRRAGDGEPVFLSGVQRLVESSALLDVLSAMPLDADERELFRRAWDRDEAAEAVFERAGPEGAAAVSVVVVPLPPRGDSPGALFLETRTPVDLADLRFLSGLTRQLGVALERIRLAAEERKRQADESRRLRTELDRVRSVSAETQLEYRTPVLQELLGRAALVATTDATVLIAGESGTGKELLARTIHRLSPRRERPFVVVDCSALTASLAESELFGHEAGAYTGAQHRRTGRLSEADKGTILLDEIGELPLDVQGKLLRFVQEKQLTSVGGNRALRVDVRILAATNRDLAAEAAAGRFRADLYHRLNVVTLRLPPLRERSDDILHLAERFVSRFALLYEKAVPVLSDEARAALLAYAWPGNVRELQNRVLQAVILATGERLEPADLGLAAAAAPAAAPRAPEAPAEAAERRAAPARANGNAWVRLREGLGALVDAAVSAPGTAARPLGRWLAADLVVLAAEAAGGVLRRAAAATGIPEATFRNRLKRATSEDGPGLAERHSSWDGVRAALRDIASERNPSSDDRFERVANVLLEEVLRRAPDDAPLGARLLGVTEETFRKRSGAAAPAPA